MATVYKSFLNNDIKSTRTLLHEAIPITGSIISGTYGSFPNGQNIKNYAHGMFQSVYDYPYLSSSANHIFDLTVGYSTQGNTMSSSTNTQNAKKVNMYNQMAAVLMGYDTTGSIIRFDADGDLTSTGDKIDNAIFINFARLLQKDEVKKGSFKIELGGQELATELPADILTITDLGAENEFRVNAAVGEYGLLSCSLGGGYLDGNNKGQAGLIFYQAGVVVLASYIFQGPSAGSLVQDAIMNKPGDANMPGMLTGSTIEACADAFRNRVEDIQFNNTTELNSTIHFCRVNNSDFNYSSNPSYLSESKIVVKNNQLDTPVSYMTTVGLYGADNELLAVAKLSEPLKKDPTNELIIRVRLDY